MRWLANTWHCYNHVEFCAQVPVLKAQPMPNFNKTFKPQLPHKKTETQPFSFEGLYRTKDEVVEELIYEDEMAAAEVIPISQTYPHFLSYF